MLGARTMETEDRPDPGAGARTVETEDRPGPGAGASAAEGTRALSPSVAASEEACVEAGPLSNKRPLPLGPHSVAARTALGTPSEPTTPRAPGPGGVWPGPGLCDLLQVGEILGFRIQFQARPL